MSPHYFVKRFLRPGKDIKEVISVRTNVTEKYVVMDFDKIMCTLINFQPFLKNDVGSGQRPLVFIPENMAKDLI